jgi:hypothetical protein
MAVAAVRQRALVTAASVGLAAVALAVLALVGACGSSGSGFTCGSAAQCNLHPGGVCEQTSFCAYPSANCVSGLKYDSNAGNGLGGTCVPPGDASVEAGARTDGGATHDSVALPDSAACVPACSGGLTCVGGACVAARCTGSVGLPNPPLTPTGAGPTSEDTADLNQDGIADLAVANAGAGTISLLLGSGGGTFQPKFDLTFAQVSTVAVGDLNGDKAPDVAAANGTSLSIVLSTTTKGASALSFAPRTDLRQGVAVGAAALADIDGDGKLDLCATVGTKVDVLINTAATNATVPSFAAPTPFGMTSTVVTPLSIKAVDLNGDTHPDLIATFSDGTNTQVFALMNTTTNPGSPTMNVTAIGPKSLPFVAVAVGDVDGDQFPDVGYMTGDSTGTLSFNKNTTATGASAPTFGSAIPVMVAPGTMAATTLDLNGDGSPDVGAVTATGLVTVSLGPAFAAHVDVPVAVKNPSNTTPTGAMGAILAADLNGDGTPDLAALDAQDSQVALLLDQTPSLGTTPLLTSFVPGATADPTPVDVEVSDVNKDGLPDVVVANHNTSAESVSVFVNTTATDAPQATFAPRADFPLGTAPTALALGDLNQDGMADVAVIDPAGNVEVLLNAGTAGAQAVMLATEAPFPTGSQPAGLAIGDMNADGKPDLVNADSGSSKISVLLNTVASPGGAASFAQNQDFLANGAPTAVALADFNGDGVLDAAVADANDPGTVSVLLNTTARGSSTVSFAPKGDFGTGGNPDALAVADVDGDGEVDLVVACPTAPGISVLRNTTARGANMPSFACHVDTSAMIAVGSPVRLTDLDDDRRPDVVLPHTFATTFGPAQIDVLLNATSGPGAAPSWTAVSYDAAPVLNTLAVGDFNADGRPDLVEVPPGTAGVLVNECLP